MPRRSKQSDPEKLASDVIELLSDFKRDFDKHSLRERVCQLIPAVHKLRDTGSSLLPHDIQSSRERIIFYLQKYPKTIIHGDELMVVSGIQDYPRRVRELRVEFGWAIMTGATITEMAQEEQGDDNEFPSMATDDYILLHNEPDREAAYRWNVANEIRRKNLSIKDKIIEYLRKNVGKPVTGEELRYLANGGTEWARRVRELRTEHGWPVVTKQTGMPELPIGTYILEMDRQSHTHDRKIPDHVRRQVMRRDGYKCQAPGCGWHIYDYNRADPRILELHHKHHHVKGGANTAENLITLCNICHDRVHADELELS